MTFWEIGEFENIGNHIYNSNTLKKTGIPVLDNYKKSTGLPNFNSIYHLESSKLYLKDAKNIIVNYPFKYLK